jgi:hypothetical protein
VINNNTPPSLAALLWEENAHQALASEVGADTIVSVFLDDFEE